MRVPVHGYLLFLHRLEQGTLRLRRCTIDLIGKHQLSKNRSRLKLKLAIALLEYGHAHDVCGQQVTGELNSLITQSEHPGERLRKHRFAESWQVFYQQMTPRQQAGEA